MTVRHLLPIPTKYEACVPLKYSERQLYVIYGVMTFDLDHMMSESFDIKVLHVYRKSAL